MRSRALPSVCTVRGPYPAPVDFELSEDQLALREAASALLDGRSPTARVREVASQSGHFDRDLWAAMAEQGWLGVERPEQDGGLGLGMVELVVLCEELGRHLAPVPFLATVLCSEALAAGIGSGELDAGEKLGSWSAVEWAERLFSGDAVGALCWSRDPGALRAAQGEDGRWRLSGRPDPVVYGSEADVVVAFAATDQGPALYALAQEEARPPAQPAMDVTRSLAWLELEDRAAVQIGGEEAAEVLLDRAATAASAEMLGSASRALEITVQYAKDRVQFGRPIGSFQAIKHRCADMLVDVEGMRSAAYYAAWAVGARDPDAHAAASVAKVWCSDAAERVMASALQVHGGIGFTWEHDMHLYLKRSQLDWVSFGDAVFHRERLAGILRPRAEAGLPIL